MQMQKWRVPLKSSFNTTFFLSILFFLATMIFLTIHSSTAQAASYPLITNISEVAKLTASDAAASNYFGISVSVSGDTAVIGAHRTTNGTVYIYERNEGGADAWGHVKTLTASDAAADDYFGYSVSISGDTIVVGASYDDDAGSASGSAYIFDRNQGGANAWGEVAKLAAADAASLDKFGTVVSISGDTVVVGAPYDDDGGDDSGSAYIFERNQGGANAWGQLKKLIASDGAPSDSFGESLSISGDLIVVGAHLDDDFGSASGSAYIFERNEGGADVWGKVKKLTASDATELDHFAQSLSINGDVIIAGAAYDDDVASSTGSAYIFERNQGGADAWGQTKKLTASDAASSDLFGTSVSINGDTVIVGANYEDGGGSNSGAAYVFNRNEGGADAWGEASKLIASDSAADDYFGYSVAINGDTIIAGAWYDNTSSVDSGSAYIYKVEYSNATPVITSDGAGATASVDAAENQMAVTTVTVTDADSDPITFSITGGADQTAFAINSSTGVLIFNSSPDFETPGDTDTNNIYIVEVTVSDGTDTDVQTISTTVTDIDEVAPTTTASPGFGAYSTAQNVTLTCDDGTGSGCDETYYCTGIGCSSFILYSSAINVSSSYTELSFYSTDLAGNIEPVAMENYSIVVVDTAPPVTTASPDFGSYSTSQNVTLSCDDGTGSGCDSTYYCLGSGCSSFTVYSSPGQFVNISTSIDLRYYSTDVVGNTESVQTSSYTIGSGNLPATVALFASFSTIPADGFSSATLTAIVTDGAGGAVADGLEVTFSASAGSLSETTVTTSGGDGTVSVTITSDTVLRDGLAGLPLVDLQATCGTVSGTSQIGFTPGPPYNISMSADPTSIIANGLDTATVSAYVTDASGTPVKDGLLVVFEYYSSTDYGHWENGNTTSDPKTTSGGMVSAIFTSSAIVGSPVFKAMIGAIWQNYSGLSIVADATAPTTNASPGFGSYSSPQSVVLTCSDGSGSGCDTTYYCLGTGCSFFDVYSGAGQFINISTSTDLRYYSSDLAGNTESVNTVSYTIGALDTTPPTTTASPGFGAYSTAQNVTLTCDDGVGSGCDETYYCTGFGCSSFILYSSAINVSSSYTELSFYSTDLAGNIEPVVMENYSIVVVDTTAPVTTASPGFGTYSTSQTVTLICDDGSGMGCDKTYYCYGSGGSTCTPSIEYSNPFTVFSSFDVRYYSTDFVGNTESIKTSSYTIGGGDLAPPTTTASPGAGSYSASQSVTLNCSDGSGSGCDMTYYCLGSGCSSFTVYSSAGQFINISTSTDIRYYSSDLLGNTEGVKTASYLIGEGEIGAIDWVATWDSGLYDVGRSATIDGSGNILVAGYSNNGSNYDFALTRYVSEGVPDTSFGGGDGVVIWDGGSTEFGLSSATDGAGNIYVAGYQDNGPNMDFALVRFTSGGVLDTTFGGGDGVVTWDSGFDDYGYSVVVDGSGNILMAGRNRNSSANYDFALVRFTPGGVLDTNFGGGDGVVTWDGGSEDWAWSSIIDGDGNILVAGNSRNGSGDSDFALVRFTSGGILDTSFGGGDGVVIWDSGTEDPGRSVALDVSGNIYMAGATHNGSNYDLALVSFTSGGVLDTNFGGGDGLFTWDVGSFDNDYSVTTTGSGNILVAGSLSNGNNSDFFLLNITPGGVLDTTFGGGDGVVTWDGGYTDIVSSVVTDSSGNIFVAGYSNNGSDNDFMLIKYFVNDAPVITSNGGGATASVNAAENQTAVTTVTATDADSDPILFTITGGADQAAFNIHSSTGVLTFNSAPDYENPGDSDVNNIYIVEVTASDGAGTDVQTISLTVTDSEETPPVTTVSPDFGTYPTSQNVTLSCFDGSGSGCDMTYYCIGSGCSSFTVYSSGQFINISSSTDLRYYSTDLVGNIESVKTASYIIDVSAPIGSVVIDGGNIFAHSSSVTLSLSAFDISSNVTQMQVSNDGTFDAEPWESYSTIKVWALSAGDGTKEVYVRFQDTVGNVSPVYSDSITLDTSTAPADVSNLNATANDDGSITLYWTASTSSDINGYNIYRDAVKINSELVKSTNYVDSSTTNGTTYTYKVTSVGLTGKESSGATIGATATVEVNTPPAAPEGLSIENSGTGDSLKVMWLPNSETDLSGYKVYWGTETGNYTGSFDVSSLTSYTINSLTAGTLYYIAVSAYDIDLNESEKSIEQTATPELVATKPDSVTDLTVTEGNSYLTLDWNAVADISGYMVYIGESDGLYGVPVRTTDTTYTFENLNNGKTYFVAVASYDLEPGHAYTASSVSDRELSSGIPYDNDSPGTPGNLSAEDAGTGGTVVLSWDRDDSFDIAGYVVTYKKTGDVVFEGIVSTGISWSHALTGLVDNVSYDFSVYSYDASGNFSEPVSVTKTPTSSGSSVDIIPPEPPLLSAVPGDNKVTLLLTAPPNDDVDYYNIYIYNLAAGKFMPLSSVSGLIHEENSAVTNGRVFDFVATAVDTSGNESGYSAPVSAVPNELPGDIEMENDPPVIGRVDGYDIVEIAKGFGKEIGHPHFNPNTDLNGDGIIDGEDVKILAPNHGKKKGL